MAVTACSSYSSDHVRTALSEALEALGGLSAFVKPGQTVLLKPNLFSPHPPEDAVTTHPELVRQVVRLCVHAGARRVWVGDSPVGAHAEAELWSRTGMIGAVAGTPAELKSWRVKQTPVSCGEDVLALPDWYSHVDTVISLPKLKTHCLTTLTCGLKNVYGLVTGQAKTQFHTRYPSPLTMSAFLVRVFAVLKPGLTIADAVVAMEGNGPAHGRPAPLGVLLASRDAVALDAVGCRALKVAPSAVPMIRLAAAAGLGCMDESGIECVGNGLDVLLSSRLKPSLSRFLRHVPEWMFGSRLRPLRMGLHLQERLCVKCGMCVTACPRKAIGMGEGRVFPVIRQTDCISCFCCVESCPQNALAVRVYLGGFLCVAQQKRERMDYR